MANEYQAHGTGWNLTPSYETPKGTDSYKTAEDFGADYGLFGQIGNWLLGTNKAAESEANAYNTARTEAFNAEQAELNRQFSASEAEKARKFNAEQAEISRNFQEMMSNTSIQRMRKDAEAAGINPLYLINKSTGASTPSGATASSTAASGSSASSSGNKQNQTKDNLSNVALSAVKILMTLAMAS